MSKKILFDPSPRRLHRWKIRNVATIMDHHRPLSSHSAYCCEALLFIPGFVDRCGTVGVWGRAGAAARRPAQNANYFCREWAGHTHSHTSTFLHAPSSCGRWSTSNRGRRVPTATRASLTRLSPSTPSCWLPLFHTDIAHLHYSWSSIMTSFFLTLDDDFIIPKARCWLHYYKNHFWFWTFCTRE